MDARPWIALLERTTDARVVVYEHHLALTIDGFVVARQPRHACLVDDVLALGRAYAREVLTNTLEVQHMKEVA